jgi:hypothetical protein
MIVTTDDQWTGVYTAIREESRKSDEKHIFIYASASDADSVCALRILEVRIVAPVRVHLVFMMQLPKIEVSLSALPFIEVVPKRSHPPRLDGRQPVRGNHG